MDLRLVLGTVIVVALLLAIVAGFAAARVLMRASEGSSRVRGGSGDRNDD